VTIKGAFSVWYKPWGSFSKKTTSGPANLGCMNVPLITPYREKKKPWDRVARMMGGSEVKLRGTLDSFSLKSSKNKKKKNTRREEMN